MRVEHRQRRRQRIGRLVVVRDDGVDAQFARQRHLRHRRAAAIHRNQQPRALLRQLAHGFGVEPVALALALRDVGRHLQSQRLEERQQQGRGSNAVDVVIAIHRHRLALLHRGRDAPYRGVHAKHQEGVVQVVQ